MTTVVVGNPFRNLRLILDQVFQGLNNILFDKEIEEVKPGITEDTTEVTEPKGYIQKGGRKQMCDAEPYQTEHAYGLVYDYEEEKVAPSFNGPQFQVYLERATELCDEDPECKYFNLWTDGGLTKFREGQCENLKDTINSTLTYEKIPNPPSLGTECEDKGYKPYNWYDFKKGVVPLSEGAGAASAVWDEYGNCVRTSCKDGQNKELNALNKCVPSIVEQLSAEEQMQRLREVKVVQDAVKDKQAVNDAKEETSGECNDAAFYFYRANPNATTYTWTKNGRSYELSPVAYTRFGQCAEATEQVVIDGGELVQDWNDDGLGDNFQTDWQSTWSGDGLAEGWEEASDRPGADVWW